MTRIRTMHDGSIFDWSKENKKCDMAIKKLKTSNNVSNTSSSLGLSSNSTGVNPYYWGTTTGSGGYVIPSTTSGTTTLSWGDGISMNSDIIEYIDIFYQLMGIDMDLYLDELVGLH